MKLKVNKQTKKHERTAAVQSSFKCCDQRLKLLITENFQSNLVENGLVKVQTSIQMFIFIFIFQKNLINAACSLSYRYAKLVPRIRHAAARLTFQVKKRKKESKRKDYRTFIVLRCLLRPKQSNNTLKFINIRALNLDFLNNRSQKHTEDLK